PKENPRLQEPGVKTAGSRRRLPVDLNVSLREGSRTSRGPCARDHDHECIVRSGLPVVLDLHRELGYSRPHVPCSGKRDLVGTGLTEAVDRIRNEMNALLLVLVIQVTARGRIRV